MVKSSGNDRKQENNIWILCLFSWKKYKKNHKDSFLKNKDENNIKFKTIFLKEKTISGIHLKSISG